MIKPILFITLILIALWLTGCWGYKEKPLKRDCLFGFKSYICRGKTNRHLLYTSSSYQNKVLRTTKGEDDSKKIIYLFGKKDKTGLRLTLRSVCKAEDTAFRSLKGLIGFPAL
ncbi:hypothetical protein [Capnocytophaga granulosa]|uniref:hypothetical protein n=1 Tax=Capnocytophaga granulosa TaxID=45242 RepID=UPI0028ECE6E8|nr:hypothetical protein [Capnocytophaga granulosa]